jgi:tetratricopeptide (TPR) repeat protein
MLSCDSLSTTTACLADTLEQFKKKGNGLFARLTPKRTCDRALFHALSPPHQVGMKEDGMEDENKTNTAVKLFHLGMLDEAEASCRETLARQRGNANAWNLLGLILHRKDCREQSIRALEMAIEVAPRSPEALNNLGNVYKESGDHARAIRCYRKAIDIAPGHAMANANIAGCLLETGELDKAEAHARNAVSTDGSLLEGISALAAVYERRKDFDKAIGVLKDAEAMFVANPDWHVRLGCAYVMSRSHELAERAFRQALRLRPDFVEAMSNLGQVLFQLGRLEEAEAVLTQALEIRPGMKEGYVNLANVLIAKCNHHGALRCIDALLALDPECASGHFLRGLALLVEGNLIDGWKEYDWRWKTQEYRLRTTNSSIPEWRGEALAGRTLLVHVEQGIGDTLQFVRYIPMIEKDGGHVILEVQPPLERLLTGIPNMDSLLIKGAPWPNVELRVPLLNIPGVFQTTLETIPAAVPYLYADPNIVPSWQAKAFSLGSGFKVGLVWAGNPDHANDHNRSMLLSELAPLADVAGVTWISLQKGPAADQIGNGSPFPALIDWTADLNDYADSAALIEQLNLVISVDTSVVHLAGGMNRPVWAMIPYAPDWRWLLDRSDSPWYPSMRLFRQRERGNWDQVVTEVAQALKAFVSTFNSSAT